MAHKPEATFPTRPLGELFRLERTAVIPAASPTESFMYHSIPAFDEMGGPSIEKGADIESNKTLVLQSSVLVSKLNPRKSRVAVVNGSGSPLRHCASTEFMVYVPKTSAASLRFFGWYMGSAAFQRRLERVATGSTNSHVRASPGETLTWQVAFPSPVEQRTIAEILDTLDEAIRRTEQIIAKLKHIRQGLLNDLLTRGIDENGELRDPERHPEQFEDSSIGSIPAAWQVRKISDLCLRVTYGFTNPMPTTADGPWMLTAAEVGYDEIDWENARHTSELAFSRLTQKSRPAPGDVLVTKDGTLGRVAVVNRDCVCVNQSVAVLKPKSRAGASYIKDYLLSPIGQERMLTDTGGSTIRHIYISRLAHMELPVPTDPEAARISSVIQVFTDRIRTEAEELQKLGLIKQGLMEDLLTGRVRVTNLEIAA